MSIDSESLALFREEVCELLVQLDTALMTLERQPDSPEAVRETFRVVHTLKSDCALVGLTDMESLLHDLETLYDRIRQGQIRIDKPIMDLTFAIKDRVAAIVEEDPDARQDARDTAILMSLAAQIDRAVAAPPSAQESAGEPAPPGQEGAPLDTPAQSRAYRIRFAPAQPGLFQSLDPASLLDDLRAQGQARVTVDTSDVPALDALRPDDCRLAWDVELVTEQGEDALRDVFVFLDDQSGVRIEAAPGLLIPDAPAKAKTPPTLRAAEASAPGLSPAPRASAAPAAPAAPASPKAEDKPSPAKAPPKEASHSLRVEAAKLDNLVNLVGELVIAQARLTQIAQRAGRPELTGVAEEIERLVGDLRDNTLNIRMLPIGTTFSRFRRLVRDLSSELGKELELVTEGGETELDKTVIEQLGDPLVHLLRNSMDHGVEPPDQREAAGKPRRGTITLSARQAGGSVIIRISDDGQGLAAEKIRAKAVERGLIGHDARLSDQETFQLIFSPGFSTAEKVTNVSGRGVGMDVVKRAIESLRGKVDIASTRGQGTVITISLPLTLAIIDGLQVQSGPELFIIPLSSVEECVELHAGKRKGLEHNRTISLRGEIVPFVRLRETFSIDGQPPSVEQIVITRHENGRTGIAVDHVVGQQQTVIKNLGRYIGRVDGISGATINGDGSMSLILDVPQLVESVLRETKAE